MGWEMMVVPFLLAGLGGLLTEKTGQLNIALEGAMGLGAFTAAALFIATGSWLLGILGALISGSLAAWIQSLILQKFKTNIFITGLGFNLLLPALAALLSQVFYGTKGSLRIPPMEGQTWAAQSLGILSLVLMMGLWQLLARTPWGLRLRASGSAPALARIRGIPVEKYQMLALVISGGLSALAGAHLVIRLGAYLSGLSAGRGWIALVALYLGARHPLGLFVAALVFAGSEVLSQNLPGYFTVPEAVVLALPYLITLGALVVYSILTRKAQLNRDLK